MLILFVRPCVNVPSSETWNFGFMTVEIQGGAWYQTSFLIFCINWSTIKIMMSLFLYRFPFTLLFLFRFCFQFRFRFLFPFPFLFRIPVSGFSRRLTNWPSWKNHKPFQRTEKSVKFPLLFFSSTTSPKIPTIHPLSEAWLPGTRIKYLLLHNTLSFIKLITNKALKHHWIRNDFPLKSKRSDFKKGEDWIIERVARKLTCWWESGSHQI